MIETEVKVKISNFASTRKVLKNIGGKQSDQVREVDIYFNHPSRDFIRTFEALRVRKSSSMKHTLTYKGPSISEHVKMRPEHTVGIDDAEMMQKILEIAGFKRIATVSKSREIWKHDKATISLDEVKSLGKFVEVEIVLEDAKEIASAEAYLRSILEELGLGAEPVIRDSYHQLIRKKIQRNGQTLQTTNNEGRI